MNVIDSNNLERDYCEKPVPTFSHPALALPAYIRASGGVRARFARRGALTFAAESGEAGGFRLRFPRNPAICEGALINSGGGLAGGDRVRNTLRLDPGAAVLFSTPAAEKIYRTDGETTSVETRLTLAAEARLSWLPQETIVFSGAAFRRALAVEMAEDAILLAAEALVFGRAATGETVRAGSAHDRWRVRRGGTLLYADDIRLNGDMHALLGRAAIGHGARACATLLFVAPEAERRIDGVRALLDSAPGCAGGASAWNGMLVARLLACETQALRLAIASIARGLSGLAPPRAWQC